MIINRKMSNALPVWRLIAAIILPSFAGSGQTNIVVTADGQAANTVNVTFK